MGGLIEIIYYCSYFLLHPISYHSYILKATSKIYTALTKHTSYFKTQKKVLTGDLEQQQLQLTAMIAMHFRPNTVNQKIIRIRFKDSVKLFFANRFSCLEKKWKDVKVY